MAAEPYSASLVSRFAVPHTPSVPQGYFRSKLYVTSSTTNPLVAAAGPLLSLLERLCISPTLPPIDSIHDNIEHELLAFHSKLDSQQYALEFTMIARYILGATIDELLGKNYIRLYGAPAAFQAFTPLSLDSADPAHQFFNIINYLKQRTNQYLDILELAYYCLIAGFEGEQHGRADGRQTLDNLIEELHQLIQQHRVNKPHRLFKEPPPITLQPVTHKPLIQLAVITACVLICIMFGSHVLLEHKAKAFLQTRTTLDEMDN